MGVNVSQYTEPGVAIQEQVIQPLPGFIGLPRQICVIGEGSACKKFKNERHLRGYITEEAVTPNSTTRQFTLARTSDQKKSTMQLFKNSTLQDPATFTIISATVIEIAANAFDATGVYTFSYQALVSLLTVDKLTGDVSGTCGAIERVGSFAGTSDFAQGKDYSLVASGIAWLPPTAPIIDGSQAQTYSGLVGTDIRLTLNGGSEKVVTFVGGDFVSANFATAQEVVTKLNASVTGLAAVTNAGKVRLSTTATGVTATIQVGNGSANSILGFTNGQFATGNGANPAQGAEYFITYTAKRPDSEFNTPILTTTLDDFLARVGDISSSNALALAGQIVYEQNPPFVFFIQVKNTGTGVAAQDIDYQTAIAAAELNADITDIIVLGNPITPAGGTKPLVRQTMRTHVTSESSLLQKAERYGWFGLAVGALPGDGETPGTFIYVATQESAVFADSPAHGRFILTGPSFMLKTFRFPDGSSRQLKLDGTFLAAACASKNAAQLSPSDGLLRKSLAGIDDVETFSRATRNLLAANGVNMIRNRAGNIEFFDPVSTDLSSAEFREINAMNQKDNAVKRVRTNLDVALVGVVPDDLNQFQLEVKSNIAVTLNAAIADGAIAPFQNDDGTRRNIDLQSDIIVSRRRSDPTTYDFNFGLFVKFIAKRLFGTYSAKIPTGA